MTTTHSHHDNVEKQFGSQASAYLSSAVHASGRDLVRLGERLAAFPDAHVLDLGCGAGHASFTAAQQVAQVTAYDLSSQMLDVVAEAAKAKGLNNVTTRQGYAESLPFEDASFEAVISRYSAHHWHDVGQALREVKRVLKPGGIFIIMDVMSPGHPVRNIWLQTVEALRDTSHVQNYSSGVVAYVYHRSWLDFTLIDNRPFAAGVHVMDCTDAHTGGINSGDPIVSGECLC